MTKLEKEIVAARKQIADTEVEIRKASENREAENKEFQQTVADQRATQTILTSTISELESLADYKADLHGQCDFVMKNFDVRQKARLQEMEAIQAAKGILSGDRMTS
eukprot:UN3050